MYTILVTVKRLSSVDGEIIGFLLCIALSTKFIHFRVLKRNVFRRCYSHFLFLIFVFYPTLAIYNLLLTKNTIKNPQQSCRWGAMKFKISNLTFLFFIEIHQIIIHLFFFIPAFFYIFFGAFWIDKIHFDLNMSVQINYVFYRFSGV